MKDTRLWQRKREALYALYVKGLDEGRFSSMRNAGIYLSKHPAPCFFISPERASLLVGRVLSGKPIDDLHVSQQRMVRRLCSDYKEYLSAHPGTKMSRVSIMNILVDRPAPEFYMTGGAVRRALRDEIRKARRKMGW